MTSRKQPISPHGFKLRLRRAEKHLCAADNRFEGLIARFGRCQIMPFSRPPLEYLLRSIISQQLSSKAAATIVGRVEKLLGRKKMNARNILALSHAQLRECGLSNAKVSYCHAIAQAELDKQINFAALYGQATEAVIDELKALKGVGDWTAQMFCIFALGHLDVLATADVGLQRGLQKLNQLPQKPAPEQMLRLTQNWQPYRSVASWYLWRLADAN